MSSIYWSIKGSTTSQKYRHTKDVNSAVLAREYLLNKGQSPVFENAFSWSSLSLSSFPVQINFCKTINSNSFNEITCWNYCQGKGETGDLLECPLSYKHRIMQLFMLEKTLKNSLACSVGGWGVTEGGWRRDVRRHGGSKFVLSETRRSCSGVCTSESQGGLPLLLTSVLQLPHWEIRESL